MTATERVITRFDNNPPTDEQILQEQLATTYAKDVEDYERAVADEAKLPKNITNDEENGLYSDYDRTLSRLQSALEAFRKKEKAPHDAKVKTVDSFFKNKTEKLKEIGKRCDESMKVYLKKKEDERRRAAEQKAEDERQAAALKLKEAEEKQREAEEARRKADEETARIQREADEAKRKAEAEAETARKKAEAEAEAIRKAAKDAADKAAEEIKRLNDKAELDAKALKAAEDAKDAADKAVKVAEREAKAVIAQSDKEIKEDTKVLKEGLKQANSEIAELNKEVKEASRDANHALDDAARADKSAAKLERAADAKSSDFSRTRGNQSLASTSDYWTGEMVDLDKLDVISLKHFVPLDAWDKAVKAAARAGHRQISGCHIYQETRVNNR